MTNSMGLINLETGTVLTAHSEPLGRIRFFTHRKLISSTKSNMRPGRSFSWETVTIIRENIRRIEELSCHFNVSKVLLLIVWLWQILLRKSKTLICAVNPEPWTIILFSQEDNTHTMSSDDIFRAKIISSLRFCNCFQWKKSVIDITNTWPFYIRIWHRHPTQTHKHEGRCLTLSVLSLCTKYFCAILPPVLPPAWHFWNKRFVVSFALNRTPDHMLWLFAIPYWYSPQNLHSSQRII